MLAMAIRSINLLPKKVTIYRRPRSSMWQARVKLESGDWYRLTTGTADEAEARDCALRFYYTADFKQKNNLPQSTRKFSSVAKYAISRMQDELNANSGKVVYKHYIQALKKYLIPYFGKLDIAKITVKELNAFNAWRDAKVSQDRWERSVQAAKNRATSVEQLKAAENIPKTIETVAHSTINTHNSALNRVFDEALLRGWITSSIKPTLMNKGAKPQSRGAFTLEEYERVYTLMRHWASTGHSKKTRELREVLRNYVLVLANTGIRHGTESANLKWKHISWFIGRDGAKYLTLNVDGKRGKRQLVARTRTADYLDRLRRINPRLKAYQTLDNLIDASVDEYVLVSRSGVRLKTDLLNAAFRTFLRENKLTHGADERPRSLYSLRHTYATFALLEGRDIHKLAVQMGTSVAMLEKYYSKVSAVLNASEHAGGS